MTGKSNPEKKLNPPDWGIYTVSSIAVLVLSPFLSYILVHISAFIIPSHPGNDSIDAMIFVVTSLWYSLSLVLLISSGLGFLGYIRAGRKSLALIPLIVNLLCLLLVLAAPIILS